VGLSELNVVDPYSLETARFDKPLVDQKCEKLVSSLCEGATGVQPTWFQMQLVPLKHDAPFPTLHFYMTFERYYVDYVINILVPALVTVACGFLAFFIPPEFGERIGLGITCVLTVMAVMFITTDSLPSTSNVTLLALYYVGSLIFTMLPLVVSCLVGYLKALSLRDEGAKNSSAEVLDMLWDLTEEVVTEEREVEERSKFLGEKLGKYVLLQLGGAGTQEHQNIVNKAAKNQAKLQEKSSEKSGVGGAKDTKRGAGKGSNYISAETLEASRSTRVRSFKNRFEIKMHMINPTYDVLADMINRVTVGLCTLNQVDT
jgi:hypothetical protein